MTTTKATSPRHCHCGCRAEVKGNYRPGHDAKHLSRLVGRMEKVTSSSLRVELYQQAVKQLPTFALKQKFRTRVAAKGFNGATLAGLPDYAVEGSPRMLRRIDAEHEDFNPERVITLGVLAYLGYSASEIRAVFG